MVRLSADLEPLCAIYGDAGPDIQKSLLKNAVSLESAGIDGIVFDLASDSDSWRRRALSALCENLDINVSVRAAVNEELMDAMLEHKPSMAIFPFDGSREETLKIAVTRLQVENILVAFEIDAELELVKKAARLKGDFLVFDCRSYCQAKTAGEQIEQLNRISKSAALGSRLSMGSIASGNFSKQKLRRLLEQKSIEEVFIGLPVFSDALVQGYEKAIESIRALS
jgi:pyridoxine 5'-phosphate synthase PdxJ